MDARLACLRPSENCTFLCRLCARFKCSQTACKSESSRNHADRTESFLSFFPTGPFPHHPSSIVHTPASYVQPGPEEISSQFSRGLQWLQLFARVGIVQHYNNHNPWLSLCCRAVRCNNQQQQKKTEYLNKSALLGQDGPTNLLKKECCGKSVTDIFHQLD